MSTQTLVEHIQERPDVSWAAAPLLPLQGHWSEAEYLWLARRTNKLVELADGYLEVLPMPSPKHQKAEYWIVNLDTEIITVLQLDDDHYIEYGAFGRGESAASLLLAGFVVQVDAVLDAKKHVYSNPKLVMNARQRKLGFGAQPREKSFPTSQIQ